jgi:prefoldin subunit 5
MEDLTEREWPVWTSRTSELLIDGLKVTQIFSNVHIQLETLRKRKFATKAGLLFEDELNKLANIISGLKVGGGDNEKIPPLEQKVKVVERRLDNLDELVSDKSDLEKLEFKFNNRIDGLEQRLSTVEAQLAQLGMGSGVGSSGLDKSFQERIESLESNMDDLLIKFPVVADNLEALTTQFDEFKKKFEAFGEKVSYIENSCSINTYKIEGIEKLLTEIQTGYDELKRLIDVLPEECMNKMKRELFHMDEKKADKSDLNKKADWSELQLKADLTEVSRLNDVSNQLDMRVRDQKNEFNEALKTMKNNYDKRLEALLQWILKQLRRLAGKDTKGETGTDIGKVKCLVCDQVVRQHTDAEIGFVGPAFPNSLKTLTTHNRPTDYIDKQTDRTHNRPMSFENDADPRKSPRDPNNQQQAWSRPRNKSPSPPRQNQQSNQSNKGNYRLSPKNLETLGVDYGYDRIFQTLTQPAVQNQRERPASASSARQGGHQQLPSTNYMQLGDRVMTGTLCCTYVRAYISIPDPIIIFILSLTLTLTLLLTLTLTITAFASSPSLGAGGANVTFPNVESSDFTGIPSGEHKLSHFKELEL